MESPSCDRAENMEPPLCVDLDGTLINTDLLMESLFALMRQAPLTALLVPFWLLWGKAHLKEQIVRRVQIDVTVLPYHTEFLTYLRRVHAAGRRLVLATASHLRFAEQVAVHLGIFEAVLATEGGQNLSRSRKGACLAAAYGERGFDYAGNSRADLAVWSRARAAILVNPVPGVARKARAQVPITAVFDDRRGAWKVYLKALRLPRWFKNLLIVVPLLATYRYDEPKAFFQAGLAFLSFGLCASSVYLLSDLLDLAAARHHPQERHHSFAAGTMSIIHGAVLVPSLLGVALLVAAPLPLEYLAVLAAYYLLTLAYSLRLKQIVFLNIPTAAGLYTTRLIAGGIAIGTTISLPVLTLSFCLFLGMVLLMRYSYDS
ncbi:membrane hypothetical protein [Gammaproteobacteria bacterium]